MKNDDKPLFSTQLPGVDKIKKWTDEEEKEIEEAENIFSTGV